MNVQPSITNLPAKNLLGICVQMSLQNNKTQELWRNFGPRISEIIGLNPNIKYSLQVYDEEYFTQFNPAKVFEKWALVEVENYNNIPIGMQEFSLQGGLYAIFHYKGSSQNHQIFEYIYQTWLPQSIYALDVRPHFEILGEKYQNNSANSEEEICIPIRFK